MNQIKENFFVLLSGVFIVILFHYHPTFAQKEWDLYKNNYSTSCDFSDKKGTCKDQDWQTAEPVKCNDRTQNGLISFCAPYSAASFISNIPCPAGYIEYNGASLYGYRDSSSVSPERRMNLTCVDLEAAPEFSLIKKVDGKENKCPQGFSTVVEPTSADKAIRCSRDQNKDAILEGLSCKADYKAKIVKPTFHGRLKCKEPLSDAEYLADVICFVGESKSTGQLMVDKCSRKRFVDMQQMRDPNKVPKDGGPKTGTVQQ
jgi:hypothetical protein